MRPTTIARIEPRSRRGTGDPGPATAAGSAAKGAAPRPRTARAIEARLARRVVGQERAIAELSLVLAMHAVRTPGVPAPNAVVVGPTGVGKTHSLAVASQVMGLPFVATDATALVPSGIVGEQVEDVLGNLVGAAESLVSAAGRRGARDDKLALAQQGIVLIDEFDKLAVPVDRATSSNQAEKQVIQRRLLKLLEGARHRIGVKRHDDAPDRFIETAGILVLVSGVFEEPRTAGRHPARRAASDGGRLTAADLVAAGFLPELLGRLPVVIEFEPLSTEDLVAILELEAVSPLAVWRTYFERALNASLRLEEAAKWVAAERAAALEMGARGLHQVLFPVLAELARETPRSRSRRVLTLGAADLMGDLPVAQVAGLLQ
jgi:ATP-dependent Clp protease ATP-binding subunit ClpX